MPKGDDCIVMLVYVFLAFISIMAIVLDDILKKNRHTSLAKITFIILTAVLFFFAALRAPDVGTDTKYYIRFFEIIKNNTISYSFLKLPALEHGYIVINKILSFFATTPQAITVLNSLLSIGAFYYFTNNKSKDKLLSLFLFITMGFFQTSFNIARSFYATFIGYVAIEKIKENKILAILLLIIAALFHKSVLVLLLVPLLEKLKWNKKNIKFYLIIAVCLSLLSSYLLPLLNFIVPSSYSSYLLSETKGVMEKALALVFHLIIFILPFALIKDKNSYIKKNKTVFVFMILEIFFYLLSIKYSMFTRVAYIFSMYLVVSIPNLLDGVDLGNRRKLKYITITMCILQFLLRLFVNNIGGTIPYNII